MCAVSLAVCLTGMEKSDVASMNFFLPLSGLAMAMSASYIHCCLSEMVTTALDDVGDIFYDKIHIFSVTTKVWRANCNDLYNICAICPLRTTRQTRRITNSSNQRMSVELLSLHRFCSVFALFSPLFTLSPDCAVKKKIVRTAHRHCK